jgi:hypothetical protein
VRVFAEASQTPVMVMEELPQYTSTSVTNMAEHLAPELIQRHSPQRFEELRRRSFSSTTLRSGPRKDDSAAKPPGTAYRSILGRRGGSGSPARSGSRLVNHTGSIYRSTRWKPCRDEIQALPPQSPIANDQA